MERRFISSTDHMPLSKSIKDNANDDNESDGHDVEEDEFDEDDEEDKNDKVTQESKAARTHMVVLNIGSSVVAQDDESIVEDNVDTKGIDENATGNGKLDSSTEKRAKFAKPSEAKAKNDKGEDNEFDVDDEFDEGDEVTQQCKAPYTSMVVPESGSLIVAQDDESVDETGVNTKDIELVLSLVDDVTRSEAIKALKAASGDVVEAIMKLTEQPNHYHLPGASSGSNTQLPPPLLPPPPQLYGSGGPGVVQPGSMVDGARIANNPIREAALKCPRCESTNTKFCYYNNYSLSQPRYYCKTCRRYWTRGGALASAGLGGSGDAGDGADSSLLSMAGLERWRSWHWRFPVLAGLDSSSSSSGLYPFYGGAEQSEPIKDKAKDDEGEDNESDAADVEDDEFDEEDNEFDEEDNEFDEEDDEFNEDDKEDDYEEVAQQLKAPHTSMVVSKTRSSIVAQDDESVDEAGVNTKDVELVMLQSGATRSEAIKALKAAAGDIVEAIMELHELGSTTKEQNPSVPSRRSFGFWDVDYPLRPSCTLWDKEKGGGDVEEPVKDKAKDEDEEGKESDLDDTEDDDERDEHDEDDESADEVAVNTKDVELVMSQALATRSMAIKALKDAAGDVVEAIIQLTQVDSTTMKQYPSDKYKPSSRIRLNWENYYMDEKEKGGEDAEAGNKSEKHNKNPMTEALVAIGNRPNDLVLEGRFRGRKTRRAGSRRTRAKLAVCERRKTVQPTPLLTGLNNHPSIYIRLGQRPPDRNHYVIQDTWTRAFELCSNAAEVYKKLLRKAGFGDFLRIQPFRIRSGGYLSALVERYFSETHTLHLGTFEIGPTPLAWSVITGIRFAGTALNPPDITPQECAKLLEFKCIEGVFFKDKLKLDVLCPKSLDFRRKPNDSDLEWMFRRLIVFLVGSCFFSGTDLMVPISLVSAMNNIQNINQYDWGSATFSAFLRGMRQKTSECCGTLSGFYPFLLLWAYEHIPYMRPSTDLTAYIFPVARRWNLANKEVPNSQNDFIWHRLELEYLEEDQVNFDPFKNFPNKAEFPIEIALSQKRIAFWGLESWEVYMGERNLRQFGLSKRIPQAPPEKRFGETDVTMNNAPKELMHGINARTLLQDEEHNYEEWFRANSLGRIVAVDQLQGKQMLGVRLVELWFRVHRDGYKILSPQDLQTLEDTKTEKHPTLKNKLKETLAESKTLKKDLDHLNAVVRSLNEERDFWRKQAFDAYDRVSALEANFSQMGLATNLVPYPTQTSLFHPDEMLPFTHGYMNNYYG